MVSSTFFARTLWLWFALFRVGNGGALGGFGVPLLLIVVDWFGLVGCAGKPELWVLKLLSWLSLLFMFPELLKMFLQRLFCWNVSRFILSYTCAWTSNHFWNSTEVAGVSIDVTVYSVHSRRMLCGTFSLAFFTSVELCRSAVYPSYWKACTKRFKNKAKATKFCLL